MKLRALVLLLVLANLGFFAWTQGWLDGAAGLPAHSDREPERLARQFQPQSVRILPPGEAAVAMSATAPAPAGSPATGLAVAPSCLEAGPFTPAEASRVEALLQPLLAAGSWERRSLEPPVAGAPRAFPAEPAVSLRVERADSMIAAQLGALGATLKAQPPGRTFAPCAR